MSYDEYYKSVSLIVSEAIENALNGEDLSDMLHQDVDESSWIIYYANAESVVREPLTDNPDAWVDIYGSLNELGAETIEQQFVIMAYHAMLADCYDALPGQLEIAFQNAIETAWIPNSALGQYQADRIAEFLAMPEYDQIVEQRELMGSAEIGSEKYEDASDELGELQCAVYDDPRVVCGVLDDPIVFDKEEDADRFYTLLELCEEYGVIP